MTEEEYKTLPEGAVLLVIRSDHRYTFTVLFYSRWGGVLPVPHHTPARPSNNRFLGVPPRAKSIAGGRGG
jgi:hypothetical protein